MSMGIENPVHILFIGLVALVVLGPKRLPEVARALGQGIREFRESINTHPDQQIVQQPPPGASTGPAPAQVIYEPVPAAPVATDAGPVVAPQAAVSGTAPQPAQAIVTPAPAGEQSAAASEPAATTAAPAQGPPAGG
jgi:TatA/E family protein of Tat protein translocase